MSAVEFQLAAPADAERILGMMRVFYVHEHVELHESEALAALQRLLADASLGRVWLIRAGGRTIGYMVLAFGYSLEFKGATPSWTSCSWTRITVAGESAGRLWTTWWPCAAS